MSAPAATHPHSPVAVAGRLSVRELLLVLLAVGLAVSISLAQISIGLLGVWVLWRGRANGVRMRWPLLGVFAAYAGWSVVAALASARPLESLAATKSIGWLAALYVVSAALPDARAARRFATWVFVAVAVTAAVSIVQVAGCPPRGEAADIAAGLFRKCDRARGFYSIYMTLAGVLTIVLAATLPRLPTLGRSAWWMGLAWLVGVAALGLTFVRGAWLAFSMGVIAGVLTLRRNLVLAALAAVAILVAVAVPGVIERVRTIGDVRDGTTRERLAMLDTGLRLVQAHPITGIGPGQVKHAYPVWATPEASRRSTSHLHNTPLQVLVERGVVGLALWLAVWVAFFSRAVRIAAALPVGRDRALVLGCIIGIAAFLAGGLFEYNFGDTEVLMMAVTFMALPFVIERETAR